MSMAEWTGSIGSVEGTPGEGAINAKGTEPFQLRRRLAGLEDLSAKTAPAPSVPATEDRVDTMEDSRRIGALRRGPIPSSAADHVGSRPSFGAVPGDDVDGVLVAHAHPQLEVAVAQPGEYGIARQLR